MRTNFSILSLSSYTITGLIAVPLFVVFSSVFFFDTQLWQHLIDTVLADYVLNSLLLCVCVGVGSMVVGSYLAWYMVHYEFFGKKLLSWLILLPLAMPAYIIAYTYTGLLDFAGPLQAMLRSMLGLAQQTAVLPDIRTLPGAIIVMILVLYPYVYLLARTAFKEQSAELMLVSKVAGVSNWGHIRKVALPLARPAIFTGGALAMMEALADYGTVAYFGVNTFTTGIYRTWFGMGNAQAASQLASLMCLFVFALLVTEKLSRKHQSRYQSRHAREIKPKAIAGKKSLAIFLLCLLPCLFGFLIPFAQLVWWSLVYIENSKFAEYMPLLLNSLLLAFISAVVIVSFALCVSYAKRLRSNKLNRFVSQFVSLGYALPGVVIAVGVVQVAGFADGKINQFMRFAFDYTPGLVISGGFAILIFAYTVRYLSVALHNSETGLERIKPNMDEVASTLGASKSRILRKIHIPLLSSSIISALLLVFVDVLKELPATLILRPFNVNTLAVKTFELASDERLIDAAAPAVSIVIAGIIPVVLLTKSLEKTK